MPSPRERADHHAASFERRARRRRCARRSASYTKLVWWFGQLPARGGAARPRPVPARRGSPAPARAITDSCSIAASAAACASALTANGSERLVDRRDHVGVTDGVADAQARRGRAPSRTSASPPRWGTAAPARVTGSPKPGSRNSRYASSITTITSAGRCLDESAPAPSVVAATPVGLFGVARNTSFVRRRDRVDQPVDVEPEVGARAGPAPTRRRPSARCRSGTPRTIATGTATSSPGSTYVSATCCSSPTEPLPTVTCSTPTPSLSASASRTAVARWSA